MTRLTALIIPALFILAICACANINKSNDSNGGETNATPHHNAGSVNNPTPQGFGEVSGDTSLIMRVEGTPITLKQVFSAMVEVAPDKYKQAVNRLVAETLIRTHKDKLKIQVDDATLEKRVKARLDKVRAQMAGKHHGSVTLEDFAKMQGKTFEDYVEEVRGKVRLLLEAEYLAAYNILKHGRAKLHIVVLADEKTAKDLLA